MSGTYTAWNNQEYPWPPPVGWELRADNRYWPVPNGSAATTPIPPAASLYRGPVGPPMPRERNQRQPVSKWMIGGLTAFGITFLLFLGSIFSFPSDEEFVLDDIAPDPFDQPIQNDGPILSDAEIDELVTITRCEVLDGQPTAAGTIRNNANGDRNFSITVEFRNEDGSLLDGFVDVKGRSGEDISFTSRSPSLSPGGKLSCKVAEVFRFIG